MKRYLLPQDGQFYKANLHAHSTLSDGKLCPEEIKVCYKMMGYSVYAYTEHTNYYDLRHLDDENFITLPSYEIAFRNYTRPAFNLYEGEPLMIDHMECVHMNLFAIDPDDPKTKAIKLYDIGGQEADGIDKEHGFTADDINEAIRRAKEAGFFVSYNHPHWSLNTAELLSKLEGIDALEIINGGSLRSSGMDFVPHVYREFAWQGKRMICVGGDDTHWVRHFARGWTMIKAPELSHKAIMKAMMDGDCYASAGPEIKELYVEDNELHIKTSAAQAIHFATAGRSKQSKLMDEKTGEPVTEAVFKLKPEYVFFHIIVKDMRGNPATTRIYYMDELQ